MTQTADHLTDFDAPKAGPEESVDARPSDAATPDAAPTTPNEPSHPPWNGSDSTEASTPSGNTPPEGTAEPTSPEWFNQAAGQGTRDPLTDNSPASPVQNERDWPKDSSQSLGDFTYPEDQPQQRAAPSDDTEGTKGGDRNMFTYIAVIALIVAVVAGTGAFLVGRGEPTEIEPTAVASDMSAVNWRGAALPVSATAGPAVRDDDLASGFAESQVGAALAAVWLSTHIDPHAGPKSFEPTIQNQLVGDTDELLQSVQSDYARLADQAGVADGEPIIVPTGEMAGWRIDGYDSSAPVIVHLKVKPATGEAIDFAVPVSYDTVRGDWFLIAPSGENAFEISPTTGTYTEFIK